MNLSLNTDGHFTNFTTKKLITNATMCLVAMNMAFLCVYKRMMFDVNGFLFIFYLMLMLIPLVILFVCTVVIILHYKN